MPDHLSGVLERLRLPVGRGFRMPHRLRDRVRGDGDLLGLLSPEHQLRRRLHSPTFSKLTRPREAQPPRGALLRPDRRGHARRGVRDRGKVRRDLFGFEPALGRPLKVNDQWLTVVGILEG